MHESEAGVARQGDREGYGQIRRWVEMTPEKAKEGFEQRTHILEQFRPKQADTYLAQVASQKERSEYPERALWEAVEVMMLDETLRDRLLAQRSKTIEASKEDHTKYTEVINRYRHLIKLVDEEFHPSYAQHEIIRHVKITSLRVRLADLLANRSFYFPKEDVSRAERIESLQYLRQQFNEEEQVGKKAEIAFIGLLRHGAQWMWGGVQKEDQFLRPATHVEHTMPREDVLHPDAGTSPIGQFNGADCVLGVDRGAVMRPIQLKTGVFVEKPGHANVVGPHMVQAFQNLLKTDYMWDASLHDYALTAQRSRYADAMGDIVRSIGLSEANQGALKAVLLPPVHKLVKKLELRDTPQSSWSITFKDLQTMLGQNKAFRDFMTLHSVPSKVDAGMFTYVSDLVRRLRSEHPQEPFWNDWPEPPKAKKPKRDFDLVPKYARIQE